jgi:ABC-2 type transport system ATP-binding protein
MQRRVGLAQSLINDPQLLILDEPTSGMDPVGARQIKDVIEKLAARGKTILLCTHLLSDVEDLCERVAIMFGGKVRAEGTCGELLEQQELTNLQTDRLPADALAEIQAVLEKRGLGLRSVEQPRRRLESLFLEIVDTARKEGTHTSGARSGGQIADFLRAGATEVAGDTEADGEEILESLAAKAAAPQAAPAEAAPADARAAVHEESDALADLVARPAAPPAAARQPEAQQAAESDLGPEEDPDDDVLASLTRR